MDYKKDLQTTSEDLDKHWLEQPMSFAKWGEEWANAVAAKDRAKQKLDVTKAEIDRDIRKDYKKFGFDSKPTEGAITAAITLSSKYQAVYEEYIEAVHDVNIMVVAKTAFEHRKKQLDNLTGLFLAGYFTRPKLQGANDPDYPLGSPQQKALQKSTLKKKKKTKTLTRRPR